MIITILAKPRVEKADEKKLCIALFLSLFVYTREAYAIFDIMAKVQSALELYKDVENKVQQYTKKLRDIEKRARQGFDLASSCYKNPKQCDPKALEAFAKDSESYVKSMKEIRVMPGAEELKKGDLKKKSDKSLAQTVETSYIYQRGQGDDIEKTSENRRLINAVVADDAALLFAKGVSARQSILVEDGSLYQVEFKKNNIDEILNAQNIVAIATQQRLNRILELRAYMASAGATAELTRQTREADE